MIYYPIFLAPVLLALLVALRKPEWGFMAACALLPFGAGAVFILSALGNMTVLASAVAFGLLAPIVLLQPALERRALVLPKPEWPVAIMLLIAGWSVFSAFVMPRLFEGDVQVISYNRVLFVEGVRVSDRFITSLSPLSPQTSNLSQPAYMLLSTVVFFGAVALGRRSGASVLERGLIVTAGVNMLLGAADVFGLDPFLSQFRTASYAILDNQTVLGVTRVIGGYPEASAFSSFTAVCFAYFMSRFIDEGRLSHGVLAAGNGALAVASLASTGLLAMAVACGVLGVRWLRDFFGQGSPGRGAAIAILGGLVLSAMFFFTPWAQVLIDIVDRLILSKPDSVSGLERSFWAQRGFEIGLETFGLGAGLGSTRSNGWISVWMGNLGVVGLALFATWFVSLLRARPGSLPAGVARYRFRAAFAAIATATAAGFASSTTADPSPFFMIVAAIAVTSRPPLGRSIKAPAQAVPAPAA